MLRIGLTGGIGSGKSTVAGLFAELGAPVIDTDVIARELVRPGQPALAAIAQALGPAVLTPTGEFDRARVRELVFADPAKRLTLEAILHPRIRETVAARIAALQAPYCIVVVPLLVEAPAAPPVDRVLVVDADPEQQVRRTMARDGLTRAQAEAILAAQASREQRLAAADDVIRNDDDVHALRDAVGQLHRRYTTLAQG